MADKKKPSAECLRAFNEWKKRDDVKLWEGK